MGSFKHVQLRCLRQPHRALWPLLKIMQWTRQPSQTSGSKGQYFNWGLTQLKPLPSTGQGKCRLHHTEQEEERMVPYSRLNLGSSQSCQEDSPACLPAQFSRVFCSRSVEFEGNWGKIATVLHSLSLPKGAVRHRAVCGPKRYKPRETASVRSICAATAI